MHIRVMVDRESSYRNILKSKLEERIKLNPKYSLRAFARDTGLSPSRISEIFSGKQGMSKKSALQVCNKLSFNKDETEYFCNLVLESDSRSKIERRVAAAKLSKYRDNDSNMKQLQLDVFHVISDWYHFAIIELTSLKNFQSDYKWIAKKLAINTHQVKSAIQRLINLSLLEKRGNRLVATDTNITTTNGVPSEAIRKFNKQILQKAINAITLQAVSERDISTLTLAINSTELPNIKERIKKFRRELNNEIKTNKAHKESDSVYCLALQLFNLTQKEI